MRLLRIGLLLLLKERRMTACIHRHIPNAKLFTTCAAGMQLHFTQTEELYDPYKLVEDDLSRLHRYIQRELHTSAANLERLCMYGFDGHGKAVRPLITALMAKAVNCHLERPSALLPSQLKIAVAMEMIHTASIMHDDVVDGSDTRRGRHSINRLSGSRKAILSGNYILFCASAMIYRLDNCEISSLLSRTIVDLVQGEFMQMGSFGTGLKENIQHYLNKTYKKTASLIACGCKAVAVLGGADRLVQEAAFQYGRHVGIAFQLVDDILDFTSSATAMGKPAGVDLKLGLATAPVLFASVEHPHLAELIERRFNRPGDADIAFECVHKSDSIERTRCLAQDHCAQAVKYVVLLADTPFQRGLVAMTDLVLKRSK